MEVLGPKCNERSGTLRWICRNPDCWEGNYGTEKLTIRLGQMGEEWPP